VDTIRHRQIGRGGVIKLPVHDKQGRVKRDENGEIVFVEVVILPNRQALETRLRWMAPDRFPARSAKTQPANEPQNEEIEHALPSELEDMFISVARRMIAMGAKFEPAIETTAKKAEEATSEPGAPKLVEKVDRGLTPAPTASTVMALPEGEQVKRAIAEDPLRAARETSEQPAMHTPTKPGAGWSLEQLLVECEKIPTSEINDWVLSPAERTISYEQRDQLTAAVRGAVRRLAELADQIEEPSLCAIKSCQMGWRGKRDKCAPGQKYCSQRCAERAGERSAWRRPTAADVA
jgi:hypothetical protein